MPYKDPEKQREYQRIRQKKNTLKYRKIVFDMFGRKCPRCGYDDNILAFQLDHIIPILRKKDETNRSQQTWRRVALGILPKENFQMLCANCHAIKTITQDVPKFKHSGRPKI